STRSRTACCSGVGLRRSPLDIATVLIEGRFVFTKSPRAAAKLAVVAPVTLIAFCRIDAAVLNAADGLGERLFDFVEEDFFRHAGIVVCGEIHDLEAIFDARSQLTG